MLFNADGTEVGTWQPLPTSKPVGVVAMPDGGFAFSDAADTRNEVEIIPADLVAGFFK